MFSQFIYHSFWAYVNIILRFYFRKWQVKGTENIPKNAAVIYVVNHQNAFLDAILVACATTDQPWFLTRAGVFASSLAKKLLAIFHMMPVYRFRDGWKSLRNNDVTITQCVNLLSKRKSILLFVEGDQTLEWKLRNLQKGFARIAQAAQQENNWQLPLYILPVGIQYDHHYTFRSRVFLNYGKAFPVDASYKDLPEREFLEVMVGKVREALEPLMLHIDSEAYDAIVRVIKSDRSKSDLAEQLAYDQQLVANWKNNPLVPLKKQKQYWSVALLFPLHLYCWINNVLPYLTLTYILKKYVSIEFMGSLKMAFGMVIVPLFYLMQGTVLHLLVGDWKITLAYLITLPFLSVWSVDLYKRAMRLE